ncbi:MAG: hypothetical protein Aurels2KO_43570 [Aureliella sp.]
MEQFGLFAGPALFHMKHDGRSRKLVGFGHYHPPVGTQTMDSRPTQRPPIQKLAVTSLITATCLLLCVAPAVAQPAEADPANPSKLDQTLARVLEPLCEGHDGDVGLAVKIVSPSGEEIGSYQYRAQEPMPTASLIKLPIMVEFYRQVDAGDISLDSSITLRDEDKVPGSGILTEHFSAGATLPVEDVVRLMIRYSDNTATNLVLDLIGLESTAKTMKQMGYPETQAHSKVYRGDTSIAPKRSSKYGLGSATADDLVDILSKLDAGQIGSDRSTKAMLDHLKSCDDGTKLGRFLPPGATLAHKTGAVTRVRTDAGIITFADHKIFVAILTANNGDRRWADDNQAEVLCGRIGRALVDAIEVPSADSSESKLLANGSTGFLVEALQRTLNKRAGAELSVDGDFGPATLAAVVAFQKANKIDPTGIVGSDTWKALGDLLTEDDPVPAPEVVNSQVLERSAPLDPNAPPEVSAKAWAILDLAKGELVAGKNADQPLAFASTTKVMTAYVVLDWIAKQPTARQQVALDEVVTFSERADNTMGSTAGVRAGEQLSVRELLYGLLLPSGNDASVALAEHFGERVQRTRMKLRPDQAYDSFVDAMNRAAKKLGMANTKFTNTHGLTEPGHLSTASDLAKLAAAALEFPLMREICSTRQRGCTLVSEEGYRRNVMWTNTNRLLGQEGFFGVKTGTTSAAGACLISLSKIDGKERVLVTLGSTNSDARYIDSRNLHAWAVRNSDSSIPQ